MKGKEYEATGVVVPQGLGVTKGLKQGIGGEDDILDPVNASTVSVAHSRHILHDLLGRLCLSGTTVEQQIQVGERQKVRKRERQTRQTRQKDRKTEKGKESHHTSLH